MQWKLIIHISNKGQMLWCSWFILLQKVIAAHKILAYGIPADLSDEYL
jgi:hypothetical protein